MNEQMTLLARYDSLLRTLIESTINNPNEPDEEVIVMFLKKKINQAFRKVYKKNEII